MVMGDINDRPRTDFLNWEKSMLDYHLMAAFHVLPQKGTFFNVTDKSEQTLYLHDQNRNGSPRLGFESEKLKSTVQDTQKL